MFTVSQVISVIKTFSILLIIITVSSCSEHVEEIPKIKESEALFVAPDTNDIPDNDFGDMVRYGRELIINTPYYIGPEGIVSHNLNNRMSCNNCHLDAGTRPFAFNFFSTFGRYPQYRGRENRILSLGERINNCIERPHNGTGLPLESKEIQAMVCYMQWVSHGVPVGERVYGDGSADLEYPNRPADIDNGAKLFALHCTSCHGNNGEGLMKIDSTGYQYPPLWGNNSYAKGSSMHRVLKAARFIKYNMPDKIARWDKPFLSDHEAIDVAAFINDDRIHYRPEKKSVKSYPRIDVKPIDYHEGEFPDTFSVLQHKFGPYQPIIDYHKEHDIPVVF